jgi:hypothetical protein
METPEGLRSASGVSEVRAGRQIAFLPDVNPIWVEVDGEAIPFDLPNGKTIYVLMEGEGGYSPKFTPVSTLIKSPIFSEETYASNVEMIRNSGGARLLSPEKYPALAMIKGSDIKNVDIVRPSELETAVGPGYRLVSMSISYTEEPVTRGIKQRVRWARADEGRQWNVEGVMVGPPSFAGWQ